MQPYFRIIEDSSAAYTPDRLFSHPELFNPIEGFTATKPGNIFWLFTHIQSSETADAVLSFKHLTYAELYILPDTPGAVYTKRYAGAFRPANQISAGDSRFHFQLDLAAGVTYRILILSQHTKQYKPVFDFSLESQYPFNKNQRQRELIDFWFQ